MNVETYLRAQVPGYPLDLAVLEYAVISPLMATPIPFQPITLNDEIDTNAADENFIESLKYATSTLFYAMSGVFSGGSTSETVGDVSASRSGFIITKSDREYYRSMGDKLRKEAGYEPEEPVQETGGMFDATGLRTPHPKRRWNL